MSDKPKIFIGSSVEGLDIAYSIQQNLTHDAEITVWNQGVFELSQTTIESLIAILEKSDFAIFVFSPDDIIKIRKKEHLTVRDNVIFELGLFIGKLGRLRSFIIMPDKLKFHIPTDILGVTSGKYDSSRSDGNFQAATGTVCHQIRTQIKKQGLLINISSESNVQKNDEQQQISNENIKEKDWWALYLDENYNEAIKLIEDEIKISPDKKDNLIFWKLLFLLKIDSKTGKEHILKYVEKFSDNKYSYTGSSRILLWENELELSLELINKGLEKFNNDPILISRKSEYYDKIGKTDDAISLILSSEYKENETLSLKLAELYENLDVKKTEEAFLLILECYKKNTSSEELMYKLARLSQDTNSENLALLLLNKLTIKFPINSTYWGYFGNTCLNLGFNNKAFLAYKKAEEISNSKEGWILSNVGNLLKNLGLYSEAKKYFDLSLKVDPNSEYAYNRIGGTLKIEQEEEEKFSKTLQEGLISIHSDKNLPLAI